MDSLNELLLRCGKGDADTFRELYRLASPKLYALARRMLRDQTLAEDVLQEGFVKIWNNASSYAVGKGSAMTWMASIIRNQALDKLRMAKSRPQLTDEADYETLDFASPELGPSALSELSDDTQHLMQCMEALKPEQRECIMQAFYYGYTHEELSQRLSHPLGTIKAWIRRGLEQLRACLA